MARLWGLAIGAYAVYSLAYLLLYPLGGPDVAVLQAVPVVAVAWRLGGVLLGGTAGLGMVAWHLAALRPAVGLPLAEAMTPGGWVGMAAVVLLGAVFGRLGELNRRLLRELAQRRRSEVVRAAELEAQTEALRHSEQRLAALVHSLNGIVWEADPSTFRFTFVSPQAERVLGYPARQWLDEPDFWRAHTHPDDVAWCSALCRDATSTGRDHEFDYRMIAADGRVVWLRDVVTVVPGPGGRAGRLCGIMLDVTDRKRAEEEASRREARLAAQRGALLAMGNDVLRDSDPEAAIRRMTEATARGLGVGRVSVWRHTEGHQAIRCVDLYEAAAGRHSSGAELTADAYPAYFQALEASDVIPAADAAADPRTQEFAADYLPTTGIGAMLDVPLRPFGRLEGVLCCEHLGAPRAWGADEQVFATAVGNLVSLVQERWQRERAEDSLRRERRFLQAVLDNVAEGIIACDADGRITLVNWYARQVGVRDEPLGPEEWERPYAVYRPDRKAPVPLNDLPLLRALRGERVRELEVAIRSPNGDWRDLVASGQPLTDPDGRRLGAVVALHDVTERKRLEEQFLQAQKMEAVGRLAGGIAHDFNNLLTIINGYADVLLEQLPPDAPGRDPVREIRAAGERSATLTRQLLAFSRKQVLVPQVVDLNELVRAAGTMLHRVIGEDVRLRTALCPGAAPVLIDPGQLEQVLMNLAVNARDAMPQGGQLTLTTRRSGAATASGAPAGGGPWVVLEVADTGEGMTEAVKARVFEPFFTTKPLGQGTGLGLASVYGIAQGAGGDVEVDSVLGAGATFRIRLPEASQPVATSPSRQGERRPTPRGTETVLVAEDEDGVRTLVRRVLEAEGYTVLEARDAGEAAQVADRHRGPIQLLVSDVVMPGGRATQAAAELAARRPGLKVLFLSGYTEDAVVRHGVWQQDVNFLEKPFTPAALAQTVREVLDGACPEPGRA